MNLTTCLTVLGLEGTIFIKVILDPDSTTCALLQNARV